MVIKIMPILKLLVNTLEMQSNFPSKKRIYSSFSVEFFIDRFRKYNLYEELARLHSSISGFYLSIPNYLQYKKEILATMEQAIHYAQLAKNTNEYLSCLYDIAQVIIIFILPGSIILL
jgi:hypothetical protein